MVASQKLVIRSNSQNLAQILEWFRKILRAHEGKFSDIFIKHKGISKFSENFGKTYGNGN